MSKYSDEFNFTQEAARHDVGEVFTHTDGHRYRVNKKTRTAIAIQRYYWFDAFFDKLIKRRP